MRAAIELGLYILYLLDHPVEVKMWANAEVNSKESDLSFADILGKVASPSYLRAASGGSPDLAKITAARNNLSQSYRMLSERVHGKYKCLQTAGSPENEFDSFDGTSHKSLSSLVRLAIGKGRPSS